MKSINIKTRHSPLSSFKIHHDTGRYFRYVKKEIRKILHEIVSFTGIFSRITEMEILQGSHHSTYCDN